MKLKFAMCLLSLLLFAPKLSWAVSCAPGSGTQIVTNYRAKVDAERKQFTFDVYGIVGETNRDWDNTVVVLSVEEPREYSGNYFYTKWVWAGTCTLVQRNETTWRCRDKDRGRAKLKIVASQENVGDLVRFSVKLKDPDMEQPLSVIHRIRTQNLFCQKPGSHDVLTEYREWEGDPSNTLSIGWTTD